MTIPSKEDGEKELFKRLVYKNCDDIMFGVWLGQNGWQPYDGMDRWINLNMRNSVMSIRNLYAEYIKENPEP